MSSAVTITPLGDKVHSGSLVLETLGAQTAPTPWAFAATDDYRALAARRRGVTLAAPTTVVAASAVPAFLGVGIVPTVAEPVPAAALAAAGVPGPGATAATAATAGVPPTANALANAAQRWYDTWASPVGAFRRATALARAAAGGGGCMDAE